MNRRRGHSGFTLIELLVSVVILGVITAALATAVMVTFRTTDEASDRLVASQAINISASAFAVDAQSAELVFADDPTGLPCGGTDAELSFVWTDTGLRSVASYHYDATTTTLRRVHCVEGQPDRSQTLSTTATAVGAPRCLTTTPATEVDCLATPQTPDEVSWSLTESNGDTHVLRGSRRSG